MHTTENTQISQTTATVVGATLGAGFLYRRLMNNPQNMRVKLPRNLAVATIAFAATRIAVEMAEPHLLVDSEETEKIKNRQKNIYVQDVLVQIALAVAVGNKTKLTKTQAATIAGAVGTGKILLSEIARRKETR